MTGIPYADEDDRTLQTGICEDPEHVLFKVTDGDAVAEVCVSKDDLAEVTAGIWQEAGSPAPVILERPENPGMFLSLLTGVDFSIRSGGVDVIRHAVSTESGMLLEPAVIRGIAASLAMLADEAERGPEPDPDPDPADAAELAAFLRENTLREGAPGRRDSEAIARAALRWMKQRETAS